MSELKGLEGFIRNYDGNFGLIQQTGPLSKDGSKPVRKKDQKPFEQVLYLEDWTNSGLTPEQIKVGQRLKYDAVPDEKSEGGKRKKAINFTLKDTAEPVSEVKQEKPKEFLVKANGSNFLELRVIDEKATNFTIAALAPKVEQVEFTVDGAKQPSPPSGRIQIKDIKSFADIEVVYPMDSLALMIRCDDTGSRQHLTLWNKQK